MKQIYRQRQSARPAPQAGAPTSGPLTPEELQLAARNHSMPLEALRRDITPPGLHYVLTHFDIPDLEAASWHLQVKGAVERSLELAWQRSGRTRPSPFRSRLSVRAMAGPCSSHVR